MNGGSLGRVSPSGTEIVVAVRAPLGVLNVMDGFELYSRCVNPVAFRLLTVTMVSVAVALRDNPAPVNVPV